MLSKSIKLQIIDEKSLIKKYQHEIRQLKKELEQIKQDIVPIPQLNDIGTDDIILLKQKVCLKHELYVRLDKWEDVLCLYRHAFERICSNLVFFVFVAI